MRITQRVRHACRKPLRVIAWKAMQLALVQGRRFGFWPRKARQLDQAISNHKGRLRPLLDRSTTLLVGDGMEEVVRRAKERFPTDVSNVVAAADEHVDLRFGYLGWSRKFETLPLPWTSDWASGRTWRPGYHADYNYSEPGVESDVKSCWEPSRFHFGITLGQAYQLTGDVRYRDTFFALLRDWVAQNPVGWSINWASPLEVAIRGINLSAALTLFKDAADCDLFFLSLRVAEHGAFLRRNIEYTDERGNHYAGNIAGLSVMGGALENVLPEAEEWISYVEARLDAEIVEQFAEDGVNREKATSYHRFVTELFLLCALIRIRRGGAMAAEARERLKGAIKFSAAYIRPDGRAPLFGDNDDARALPLSGAPRSDHHHLLVLGSNLLGEAVGTDATDAAFFESLWLLGSSTVGGSLAEDERKPPSVSTFPAGGFHVLRYDRDYLMIDAGEVGLQGGGCHGHHDLLSFELCLDGRPLIVDRGSPCYTGNVDLKNEFRRTQSHNTAVVDGREQGTLDPTLLWHLGNEAKPIDVSCGERDGLLYFEGGHTGYTRFPEGVVHHRSLTLGDGRFSGTDSFAGCGRHSIEVWFQLAAGVEARRWGTGMELRRDDASRWLFRWTPAVTCSIVRRPVSPAYGVLVPATALCLGGQYRLPWLIRYDISSWPEVGG